MHRYDIMSVTHKEKLIELVKLNPTLWKHNRKARGLKQNLWDHVGATLGTTGFDAKRQWEILRDQLRRENKRCRLNPHYKSKWIFYSKMLFSLPQKHAAAAAAHSGYSDDDRDGEHNHIDFQQQIDNNYSTLRAKDEPSIIQVRKDLHRSNESLSLQSLEGYFLAETTTPTTPAAPPPDNRPSTSAGFSSSNQLPSLSRCKLDVADVNVDPCETKQFRNNRYPACDEDDEDYYFAMSLVPSLRCMPRPKKLRVRSKILDLIASVFEDEYADDNSYGMTLVTQDNIEEESTHEQQLIPEDMLQVSMKS